MWVANRIRSVSYTHLDVYKRQLYALRKRLAAKQKLPAYMVFNDSTLRQMALKKPLSVEELLNLSLIHI